MAAVVKTSRCARRLGRETNEVGERAGGMVVGVSQPVRLGRVMTITHGAGGATDPDTTTTTPRSIPSPPPRADLRRGGDGLRLFVCLLTLTVGGQQCGHSRLCGCYVSVVNPRLWKITLGYLGYSPNTGTCAWTLTLYIEV